MNYIKLLNAVYGEFFEDDRLNATHISLYLALFQEWNLSRFAKEFFINRSDIMRASKIASKTSYHRCLVELKDWGYIQYFPSKNPYKSSKVSMVIFKTTDCRSSGEYDPKLEKLEAEFCTSNELQPVPESDQVMDQQYIRNEPAMDQLGTSNGQAEVSPLNGNKQTNSIKLPKDKESIYAFFKQKGFDIAEGTKFLEYYQLRNWTTNDGKKIRDWRAVANSWMDRAFKRPVISVPKGDNLKTKKIKDYGQSL